MYMHGLLKFTASRNVLHAYIEFTYVYHYIVYIYECVAIALPESAQLTCMVVRSTRMPI